MYKLTFKETCFVSVVSLAIVAAIYKYDDYHEKKNENISFSYEELAEGNVLVSGQVKYDVASKWFLAERKSITGGHELVILNEDGFDILTGEFVSEIHNVEGVLLSLEDNIVFVEPLSKYLIDTEKRDLYSSSDFEEIINLIATNYGWHKDKTLKVSY